MPGLSIGVLEERRNAKIRELSQVGPVLQGSISTISVTCGNANCKCARGEKHTSNILTKKVNGKTKTVYLPVDMLEEAREWTQEYRRMKKLMKEISDYNEKILKAYVQTNRAKKRNQAAAQKITRKKSST
jgi:cytochrome c553